MSSEYIEYNFNLEIKATCSKTCERCKMCKWLKLCDQGSQTIPHFHLCPFLLYRHLSHLYLFAFPCHLFQPCHLCRLYSSHFFHPSLCLVALPVTSWNKYQAGRESCSMPSLKSERVLQLCKASLTMKWVQLRQVAVCSCRSCSGFSAKVLASSAHDHVWNGTPSTTLPGVRLTWKNSSSNRSASFPNLNTKIRHPHLHWCFAHHPEYETSESLVSDAPDKLGHGCFTTTGQL